MIKKIKECSALEDVTIIARLSDVQIKKTNTGDDYASMLAYDGESKIDAKMWKFTEDLKQKLVSGEVYVVKGRMKDYQGKLQININDIRKVDQNDHVNLDDYYDKAKLSSEELAAKINDYYTKIDNPILRDTVKKVLMKNYDNFFNYPAGVTMHHNYYSGLAYHTYCMLKLSDGYLELYPFLNKNLVYAGIILHDIGKLFELSGPKGTEYTKAGKLLGHISLGANEVYAVARDAGYEKSEEILNLLHVILSHHGELEYGSPKEPMTPEAELIHLLDYSDSRLASLEGEVVKTEKGEYTQAISAFEKKNFYIPDIQ